MKMMSVGRRSPFLFVGSLALMYALLKYNRFVKLFMINPAPPYLPIVNVVPIMLKSWEVTDFAATGSRMNDSPRSFSILTDAAMLEMVKLSMTGFFDKAVHLTARTLTVPDVRFAVKVTL